MLFLSRRCLRRKYERENFLLSGDLLKTTCEIAYFVPAVQCTKIQVLWTPMKSNAQLKVPILTSNENFSELTRLILILID